MTDRYVIVYRDGYVGPEETESSSREVVKAHMRFLVPEFRPAYRIRIREKVRGMTLDCADSHSRPSRLDPHYEHVRLSAKLALYEVTGRTVAAGAEK